MIVEDERTPKRVLEVGCATGTFGAVLKQLGHEVWGVEMAPEAAAVAETRLDVVYNGSIEAFFNEAPAESTFDYIVFGDVLEHTVAPLEVLRSATQRLSKEGAIIASIPNIAHLAVRLMLLEGRWTYDRVGLLDETHLRFFTRESIVELFTASNLAIERMNAIRQSVSATLIPVSEMLLATVGPLLDDPDCDVFQYIVFARNTPDALVPPARNASFKSVPARVAPSPDEILQKTRERLADNERQLSALTQAHSELQRRLLELGQGLSTALSVTEKVERKLARVKKHLTQPRRGWRRHARNLLLRLI